MDWRLRLRALVGLFVAMALLTSARAAHAWVEMHVASDDVRVAIDRSGRARVEHRVTIKVSGGPLRGFDIVGIDEDAMPLGDGYAAPARDGGGGPVGAIAAAVPITLELVKPPPAKDGRPQPLRLRVRFAQERGIGRGVYVVVARYQTDFAARGFLTRAGAFTRVRWKGAIWDDGLDSARATFELPASPTEPRPDDPTDAPDAASDDEAPLPPFLSSVRRGAEHDEIDLVRPYAPKSEPIVWTLRVDPHAFAPASSTPAAAPLDAPTPELGVVAKARRAATLGIAAALLVAYALVVALKFREAAARAREAGAKARPLLRAPLFARAPLAALALLSGLALELLLEDATAGAALVGIATALSAHRAPVWPRARALRRPGTWLPLAESDAFRDPPRPRGVVWDASTWPGRLLLGALLAAIATGVALLARSSSYYATLLGLDAAPLLAIFCTGRIAELPPDPAAAPARFLRGVARRIRRAMRDDVRLVARIHVPEAEVDADELRLALVPRAALPGFVAIEIGVVYAQGAGGSLALPEVLLRVTAGSPCEQATRSVARHGRGARGRKPEERVVSLSPKLPTARMTASIACALASLVRRPDDAPESPPDERPTRRRRRKPASRGDGASTARNAAA